MIDTLNHKQVHKSDVKKYIRYEHFEVYIINVVLHYKEQYIHTYNARSMFSSLSLGL